MCASYIAVGICCTVCNQHIHLFYTQLCLCHIVTSIDILCKRVEKC